MCVCVCVCAYLAEGLHGCGDHGRGRDYEAEQVDAHEPTQDGVPAPSQKYHDNVFSRNMVKQHGQFKNYRNMAAVTS